MLNDVCCRKMLFFFFREIGSQHFQFCFFKCIAFDDDIYMTLHFRSRILISARANVFFCPTFALSFEWAALSSSISSSSSRTFSLRWFSSSTTSNFVTRSYQYRSIYVHTSSLLKSLKNRSMLEVTHSSSYLIQLS